MSERARVLVEWFDSSSGGRPSAKFPVEVSRLPRVSGRFHREIWPTVSATAGRMLQRDPLRVEEQLFAPKCQTASNLLAIEGSRDCLS